MWDQSTGSLKFGVWTPSCVPEIKHRSTVLPDTNSLDTGQGQGSDGSQGDKKKDCSLFCEGFLNSCGCELPTLELTEWGDAIAPHPSRLTDFSEQHSGPQWRLETLTPSLTPLHPTSTSLLGRVILRTSAAGSSPRRPA